MIEGIIQAISIALDAEFGESYKIYPELTEQELSKPCFFVYCLETSCNVYRGKRYFSKNTFVIQYFPYSSDIEMECNRVAGVDYLPGREYADFRDKDECKNRGWKAVF